ncbi:hypothetical protein [Streptomyces sp. NEAU-W12]|nr:hypothetical protein [Streptomyces sp. NEAU-W12]MCX2926757.1 hypothetical protein [Streptomyces sp. NEAU-W12]
MSAGHDVLRPAFLLKDLQARATDEGGRDLYLVAWPAAGARPG